MQDRKHPEWPLIFIRISARSVTILYYTFVFITFIGWPHCDCDMFTCTLSLYALKSTLVNKNCSRVFNVKPNVDSMRVITLVAMVLLLE